MSNADPNVKITSNADQKGCKGFMGSIISAIIGLGLFLGSFYVLFSNEQKTDFSKIASAAILMASDQDQTQGKAGDLVAITGELKTEEVISVDEFIIPSKYIAMTRSTEIYAWEEDSTSETKGDKTVTTYDYKKVWTSSPEKSSSFHNPSGHSNLDKTIENKTVEASSATIGKYNVAVPKLDMKNVYEALALNNTTVKPEEVKRIVDNKYLFFGIKPMTAPVVGNQSVENKHVTTPATVTQTTETNSVTNTSTATQTVEKISMSNPEIGDQRVEYQIIPASVQGTIFATISGSDLVPFITSKKEKFFSFRKGNFEEAVDTLKGEYLTSLWLMRGLGFVLMLVGMLMFFGPLFHVLDIIPILGDFAGGLLFIVLLIVAIILTGITIFAGFLFKNIVYVIAFIAILVIIGIAVTVLLLSVARKRKA